MSDDVRRVRVSGQFPMLMMAFGVVMFIAEHFHQLTWWAIAKLIFWPCAAGYYAAEYVYRRGF